MGPSEPPFRGGSNDAWVLGSPPLTEGRYSPPIGIADAAVRSELAGGPIGGPCMPLHASIAAPAAWHPAAIVCNLVQQPLHNHMTCDH